MGFETKTGSPSKGLLLFPSALRSALCLFVNMRQKHVIPVTPFGSTSNEKTGVCAGGRGLFVLLWKMSMDEGAGCRSGTALDLVITREDGGGRRWQPWRSSICRGTGRVATDAPSVSHLLLLLLLQQNLFTSKCLLQWIIHRHAYGYRLQCACGWAC